MKTTTRLIGAALTLVLASGCASPKIIKEYKDEIRDLREERTQLKKRNRDLQLELESAVVSLATTPAVEASMPMPVFTLPDNAFDDAGVSAARNSNGDLVVSISNEVTFSSGKATLTQTGKKTLRSVARDLMADYDSYEFWIEGHTDSDPIRKSSWANNRELSYARASAVYTFLVEECDLPDASCRVVAVGQYAPVASNSSKTDKAKNRRVQIVVRR